MHAVAVCQTTDRAQGVALAMAALAKSPDTFEIKGRRVFLKPNFNTADPAPGSTDNQTLLALVDQLWAAGAASITLGERSWQNTHRVIEDKKILPPLKEKGVEVIVFDDLPSADWVEIKTPSHHWPEGFKVARPILEADCLVETCCLKTHAYGGVITMSLKLAVGVLPGNGQDPRYMQALHSSPQQRRMIAEINTAFRPELVVLDGVDAFVDGGPMSGQRARGNLMLAGVNRVAVDAVGVACLKRLGANRSIMERPIFQQEQIAAAVELGLGPAGPGGVELAAADPGSLELTAALRSILDQG